MEVEHDLEEEEDLDISDNKEEDVVRCLCEVFEDSGLMIQVCCLVLFDKTISCHKTLL